MSLKHAQHGDDAVGRAVGAADVGSCGADVVNGQADATRILRDFGALLEGVIDAADAVLLLVSKKQLDICGLGVPALKRVGVAWVNQPSDIML